LDVVCGQQRVGMKSKAPSGLFDVVGLYSGRPLDEVCGQQGVGMKSKAPSGLFDVVGLYSGRPLDVVCGVLLCAT